MTQIEVNPHVDLNNARNLHRGSEFKIGDVIDRPTGEKLLLWRKLAALYDRIERESKERKEKHTTNAKAEAGRGERESTQRGK